VVIPTQSRHILATDGQLTCLHRSTQEAPMDLSLLLLPVSVVVWMLCYGPMHRAEAAEPQRTRDCPEIAALLAQPDTKVPQE